jgi:LPPG:FO 2-phospho-L-lactate transferase
MKVAVLCGGVGAARFLRALAMVHPPGDTTAIINVGDDTVIHGLHVSPDIDTITYTLGNVIDAERGWGLAGESWNAMYALARFTEVRPAGSSAGATWFNLGDRDLATHFYRTARLAEGGTLTKVTSEIATAFGVGQQLLPVSDESLRTTVTLDDGDVVPFQDYFVRLRHSVPVRDVHFVHDRAQPTGAVVEALRSAHVIVIAPSNPLVSIAPIRAVANIDDMLMSRRDKVVAVSPIVGGSALKGPADRMLSELGHRADVVGVAALYAPIASALVIDPVDAHLAAETNLAGLRAVITPSVMTDPATSANLAETVLAAVT